MLQVQRSHTGEYTVESKRRHFGGNLTQCLAQGPHPLEHLQGERISYIWISQVLRRVRRRAERQQLLLFLKHILLCHDKASRSKCRPGRTLRYSRKVLVTCASPLFQAVGWKPGSLTLAWLRGTLVLTHQHPRTEKATCPDFGHGWRHSQEAILALPREHTMGWLDGKMLSRLFGLDSKLLYPFPE